ERLFDYQWGLVLLQRVLDGLKEDYESNEKGTLFAALKGFLTGERDDVSYKDVAAELRMTEGAVKVAVHRLRGRYRDLLIAAIAETVATPDEIDAEIRHLRKAVSL